MKKFICLHLLAASFCIMASAVIIWEGDYTGHKIPFLIIDIGLAGYNLSMARKLSKV
jgi:hypothetical protein